MSFARCQTRSWLSPPQRSPPGDSTAPWGPCTRAPSLWGLFTCPGRAGCCLPQVLQPLHSVTVLSNIPILLKVCMWLFSYPSVASTRPEPCPTYRGTPEPTTALKSLVLVNEIDWINVLVRLLMLRDNPKSPSTQLAGRIWKAGGGLREATVSGSSSGPPWLQDD